MKKYFLYFTSAVFVVTTVFIFFNCGDKTDDTIEIPFTDFSLRETPQWVWRCMNTGTGVDNWVVIINSDEELREYIYVLPSSSYYDEDWEDWYIGFPEIDFSEHSLVLARGILANPVSEMSKKFFRQCKCDNNYVLNVTITTFENATDIHRWCTALVTSKLDENSHIELKVVTTHDKGIVEIPFEELVFINPEYQFCQSCCWKTPTIHPWRDDDELLTYWEKIFVMNSNEELDTHTHCDYTDIDFSEHTLLLIKGYVPRNGNRVGNTVFFKNSLGKYVLNLSVHDGITATSSVFFKAILIPKPIGEETIRLDVSRIGEPYSIIENKQP